MEGLLDLIKHRVLAFQHRFEYHYGHSVQHQDEVDPMSKHESPAWNNAREEMLRAEHPELFEDESVKVRENRVRRWADRQGLQLQKSRRRDPQAVDYGRYRIVEARTDGVVVGANVTDYDMTLDDVESWFLRQAEDHPADHVASEEVVEADRLWQGFKRDLLQGVVPTNNPKRQTRALNRMSRKWEQLCELAPGFAAAVYGQLDIIVMSMARRGEPNSPADHVWRQANEFLGVVKIGREKHPDVEVETIGELYELGTEAIRREVDDDSGGG